jgi:hypothetical protein
MCPEMKADALPLHHVVSKRRLSAADYRDLRASGCDPQWIEVCHRTGTSFLGSLIKGLCGLKSERILDESRALLLVGTNGAPER